MCGPLISKVTALPTEPQLMPWKSEIYVMELSKVRFSNKALVTDAHQLTFVKRSSIPKGRFQVRTLHGLYT